MIHQFIQARNYTKSGTREPSLIVIHTMESPEKPRGAEAVAKWFASIAAPRASAHYCIDATDIVQCVGELDVAWAAPGANRQGIHLEHAGYARQTPAEWADAYSQAELRLSAQLAAEIAFRWAIPLRWLTPEEVARKERGICDHATCTKAFHVIGGHTDVGPNFPRERYIELIQAAAQELCFSK